MEYYSEGDNDEVFLEPCSPCAQYMNSSVLSLCIIAVLEIGIPVQLDDSVILSEIKDLFLPINPRFSSIMMDEKDGEKKWKPVEVNIKDHLKVPTYPAGKPVEFYDHCLSEYLTQIGMEPFPQNRPLWEIHLFKYPTTIAAANCIFKLHHALGDGYSLMGALLSCLKWADNPALPLTFPSRQRRNKNKGKNNNVVAGAFKAMPRFLSGVVHTVSDFSLSLMKSSLIDDDKTAIHSQEDGIEFRPIGVTPMEFSLYHLKQIKSSLNVTINDVIVGIITYGTRLYMQETDSETCNGECTSVVLFNTRAIGGYKSVSEMVKPKAEMPWGNRFAFLPFAVPKLMPRAGGGGDDDDSISNPLRFVLKAHHMVKRQRNSASVHLTGQFLELSRKLRGPEVAAGYLRGTLRNTSVCMTNMIGPVEETTLVNHPVKGMYFFVTGLPLLKINHIGELLVTMVSYVGKLRLGLVTEKDFIDGNKLKSCIESAFDEIFRLAVKSSPPTPRA